MTIQDEPGFAATVRENCPFDCDYPKCLIDGPACGIRVDGIAAGILAERRRCTTQWQNIETAPKNQDILLGRTRDDFRVTVCWDDEPIVKDFNWATADGISYHAKAFTHWMPLPDPPITEAIERGEPSE